jgi:signal transduction histidine kinase
MRNELKILMLEDLEEDAGLIERLLRKENFQFTSKRIDTEEDFRKGLEEFKPDVILSDHSLPSFNSIEAFTICQEKKFNGPFILVTGSVSEEFAVMCLKKGADDYILKSNLSRLPIAINTALTLRKTKIKQLRQQEAIGKQNQELIKINEELDSFVYSISHNLRAPLTSVQGLVNLARLEDPNDYQLAQDYFTLIEQSILKLDDTLKEILDYSRNSRSELVIEKNDLNTLLKDVVNNLSFMKDFAKIDWKITVNQPHEFYSDNYRLRSILTNILSNSIKYSDNQKSNSFIHIEADVDTYTVILKISDNGTGIQNDQLPKIYQMFYRGTVLSEGAGLGLYITREMIRKLNGDITINSTFGKRTDVTLTIPNMEGFEHTA